MANGDSGIGTLLTQLAAALGVSPTAASLATMSGPLVDDDAGATALTAAVEQLRSAEQVQAAVISQNTDAPAGSSGTSGDSALERAGSAVAGALGNGFGVAPLIGGLASLFGGGGSSAPPPLSVYTAPESIQFEGDVYRGEGMTDWSGSRGVASGASLPSNAQITVQVNAMDSRSFLDHSQEIANAVRQAMLNSSSLNDVVSDL